MGEMVAVGAVQPGMYPFDESDLDAMIEQLDAVLDAWFMAEVIPALRETSATAVARPAYAPALVAVPA